jgi:hypothetical protein
MGNQVARTEASPPPPLPAPLLPWVDQEEAKRQSRIFRSTEWWNPNVIPADVRALLPAAIIVHERAMVPAPATFIAAMMAKLASCFPNTGRSQADWTAYIEAVTEDLACFPPDIIVDAIRRHRRESKFFPTVAEIYQPCADLLAARRFQLDRLKKLLKVETPEERDAREQAEREARRQQRAAEIEVNPYLGIIDRWRGKLRFRGMVGDWPNFVKVNVTAFGLEAVEAWHQQAASECIFPDDDAMPILCRLRDAAEQAQP